MNGKYLGILWKTPFKLDVTGALKPGSNQIVIQVTNLWVNRLIGDQQSYAVKKYTFTDFAPYKADSPLLPSGLLGPVRLLSTTQIKRGWGAPAPSGSRCRPHGSPAFHSGSQRRSFSDRQTCAHSPILSERNTGDFHLCAMNLFTRV